jgi:hypothetical protein
VIRATQAQMTGRSFWLASPGTATVLAVLVLVLAAAVIPLSALAHQSVRANAAQLVIGLPIVAAGFIIARRQPGNPIGWLLLLMAVGILISLHAGPYVLLVYRMGYRLPFGSAAVILEFTYLPALFAALCLGVAILRYRLYDLITVVNHALEPRISTR